MKVFPSLCSLALSAFFVGGAQAQLIYVPYEFRTLAGLAGNTWGADGTGSAARFDFPFGLDVDRQGNIYVADSSNSTIRKITPAGVVTTVAGSAGLSGSNDGTGSAARFSNPTDVAVDSAGNLYVTDAENSTIRKITPGGVVSTMAGSPGIWDHRDGIGSAARFRLPSGIAIDYTGNLYVTDTFNYVIRKITPAGAVTTIIGTPLVRGDADGTGPAAQFFSPYGIARDGAGTFL